MVHVARVHVARTKKTYDVQSGCLWPGQKEEKEKRKKGPTIPRSVRVAGSKHQQRIFRHNAHKKAHRVSHKDVHDWNNIRVHMTETT